MVTFTGDMRSLQTLSYAFVKLYFQTDGSPDPHLYIWDVETNRMEFFNFESGRGEQDELYMNETQDEDASALDK